MDAAIQEILVRYDLDPNAKVEPIGSGHINWTYRVAEAKSYILQRINVAVFTRPEWIESNLRCACRYLQQRDPDYLFVAPLPTTSGEGMAWDSDRRPWRLFPFLENTLTIDRVETLEQAFNAAAEFGRLARMLVGIDLSEFRETIPRFHDLSWRLQQFDDALAAASPERLQASVDETRVCQQFRYLADRLARLIQDGVLRQGVFHNDTKINNVLFDANRRDTVAVVDLDTLMPGYFIYDLGDLVRTVVSPVGEEADDVGQIAVRREFFDALVDGYLSEMGEALSPAEREQIPFAGQMMTYIMALRFLADYLRGDTYYQTHFPGQNLVRARNQLQILQLLSREIGIG